MTTFPLGRKLYHDERSRAFPARTAETIRTLRHKRYGRILDQGLLGSCTGNALAGALNTVPLRVPRRLLHQKQAIELYAMATGIDRWPGTYPPDDTGSDGLSVCKAAVQLGYLTSYSHAFGFDHYLQALMLSPVIIGVNWYESFNHPDAKGFITAVGRPVGGHEVEIVGYDARYAYSLAANSWSNKWGRYGLFRIPDDLMVRLLREDGDVTVPTSSLGT